MEKDKIDRGFEIFYDKLSYRRKFIRTVLLIPVGIAVGILIANINVLIFLLYCFLFIIIAVRQLKYNYTMWKKGNKQINL